MKILVNFFAFSKPKAKGINFEIKTFMYSKSTDTRVHTRTLTQIHTHTQLLYIS